MKTILFSILVALLLSAFTSNQPLTVYVYTFDSKGVLIYDSPFEHWMYPSAMPRAVFQAELCQEPKVKIRHLPQSGDTVFVNSIRNGHELTGTFWCVLKEPLQ